MNELLSMIGVMGAINQAPTRQCIGHMGAINRPLP
jgi:hypothetical protein